jgi:hypothetical protein
LETLDLLAELFLELIFALELTLGFFLAELFLELFFVLELLDSLADFFLELIVALSLSTTRTTNQNMFS